MDYNKISNLNLDGNGNIVLQDINGSTITVNYNDTAEFNRLLAQANESLFSRIVNLINTHENTNRNFVDLLKKFLDLPHEVKQVKEKIALKFTELTETLFELEEKYKNRPVKPNDNCKSEYFDDEQWEYLIDAIKDGGCVLFIGQEISVDENGKSLHEKFFKELEQQFSVEYIADEGFFVPSDNDMIKYKVKKYYRETFHQKNIQGRKMLMQLAQIPFSLIVSLTPDNTIHRIFDDFSKKHQYHYHQANTKPTIDKPTKENPLVYNILGEAEKYEYIFTHEQFYGYIRNIDLHPEVKMLLKNATHYLFFGFDFNKWYNRLLLFFLEMNDRKTRPQGHAFEKKGILPEFKKFVKNQFNITYIADNYDEFLCQLSMRTGNEGINNNLGENFITCKKSEIESIKMQLVDKNNYQELLKLAEDMDGIATQILTFKKLDR